ncbi:hypothetical protein LS2_13 [Escherichia virus LS2]|uniref:Uncharacterized protein n=1 Tax=Escherichia virus LS2 TaxID=2743776 RepID=A0ACD4QLC9_9CAUD
MNHYELKDFLSKQQRVLDLWLSTTGMLQRRLKVERVSFRTDYSKNGYERGTCYRDLSLLDSLGPTEYADAIGPAYNGLAYTIWRITQ